MNAETRAELRSSIVLELLDAHFHDALEAEPSSTVRRMQRRALYAPLQELLGRPGKELRASLVRTGHACGGSPAECPEELPILIELLHAGSLVVDDIEDGSSERRGAPTLHRVHGLPVALNAANWLYFWPLTLLSRLALPPARELDLHRRIHRTLLLCHQGQALDLTASTAELDRDDVRPLVERKSLLKTAALVELALVLGAVVGDADEPTIRSLARLGRDLGIGLQMLDDASGLVSPRRRDKLREDLRAGKPTWPFVWAADRLDRAGWAELQTLAAAVSDGSEDAGLLEARLGAVIGDDPKLLPRATIERALAAAASLLEGSTIARIRRDVIAPMVMGYA